MKKIIIPFAQELFDQIETLVPNHGLIIIAGSNQNRTQWASYEALNVLHRRHPNANRKDYVVTMGELDQYNDLDRFQSVEIDKIDSSMIVYGGAIRSVEKANLLLQAAKICPVIAIIHATDAQERFNEMGCAPEEVQETVKIIFCLA